MFRPRPRHYGAQRQSGMALALLAMQMAQVGFDNIPPVTLSAILAQVAIFLKFLKLPSVHDVCISSINVWYKQEIDRVILSAIFHSTEWHLYYNMASLLWKGRQIEPKVGSGYFMYLIAVFTVLTGLVYVGIGLAAEQFLHDPYYISACAVGFSGVLFALKVITTHMSPGTQRIMGFIPIPSRYACWAELVLIHLLVPGSSFMGHLSGIIVGLLYVKGPLKPLMDSIISPNPVSRNYARNGRGFSFQSSGSRNRDWGTGSSNYATNNGHMNDAGAARGSRSQQAYSQFTDGMTEEQQMQHAMRESLRQGTTPRRAEPSAPPADHLPDFPPPPYPGTQAGYPPPPYPVNTDPSPSTGGSGLYPDLTGLDRDDHHRPASTPQSSRGEMNPEDLRRRRLQRFDS